MRKVVVACLLLLLIIPVTGFHGGAGDSVQTYGQFATNSMYNFMKAGSCAVEEGESGVQWDDYGLVPWWVDMVDAENVDNDGEGVYIAVLDTGLVSNWEYLFWNADIADDLGKGFSHTITWDGTLGDFVWSDVEDDRGFVTGTFGSGHGTHVTSTIVGYEYGTWVRGVAPMATIIPVLVLDTWFLSCPDEEYVNEEWGTEELGGYVKFAGGTDAMVAAGINYAASLKEDLDAPLIISMSLGGSTPSSLVKSAIDNALDEGCIIVASAGNEGLAGMGWPGAYPEVISAGAAGWTELFYWSSSWYLRDVPENLKTQDVYENTWQLYLEDFSSVPNIKLGQKSYHLDVCDPGGAVVGPYQRDITWSGTGWWYYSWGYYYLWGTSMAAPHVSAIAALVSEDYDDLEQEDMETILKSAANGNPFPSSEVEYLWIYEGWAADPWWTCQCKGTHWGSGFLTADQALDKADNY